MIEEIGSIDEAAMWIEIPSTVSVWRVEERLRTRGLTLGPQPPSVLRRTVREWLEGPNAGRWVEGGRLACCAAAIKVRLDDGSVVRTLPAPRSAMGPSIAHVFLGSQGSRGEILWAVLRAQRLRRRSVEIAYEGPPRTLAAWLQQECRRIEPPRGAEIVGGDPAVLSLLFSADTELERARATAAADAARAFGLGRAETPGLAASERDWESEVPADAWESLLSAIPAGHRVWLTRIARETAVAVTSEVTGRHLPVMVEPSLDLEPLAERLGQALRLH